MARVAVSKGKPTVSIETITPRQAERYLEKNLVNRAIRPTLVARYANIILEDEWHLNGETIKFDTEGNLLDGQHRLMAVVEADTAVDFTVVRNLPAETRSSIDIGARRSMADWLKMNGEVDTINLATAINWYYRLTEVTDPRIKQAEFPTYHQGMELLAANPGLRDALKEFKPRLSEVTGRGALMCAQFYWFRQIDPKGLEPFADGVVFGAGLAKGSSILALRRALNNDRRRELGKSTSINIAALVIKAFNYHRSDHYTTTLSWRYVEKFPRPLSPKEIREGITDEEDE